MDRHWTEIMDIMIDPQNSQTLYAADHSTGVYVSIDGGMNWNSMNEGLTTKAVTALTISADGQVLYAATEGGGVFRIGEVDRIMRIPKPREIIFPGKTGYIIKK